MIDNVVLIMTGVMKGEELDREELMSKCHPLGILDVMPALTLSRSLPDLYTTILLETPIGPYFQSSEILNSNEGGIEGMNVELVRLALGKAYLEDFHKWCTTVADDVTKETMGEILSVYPFCVMRG
jgi:V-type H+-transporting ATPase subunit d